MKYLGIIPDDAINGEGIRVTLFVSGCSHHCKGCQNPETWNCNEGKEFLEDTKEYLFNLLDNEFIDGITFSGGDPLFELNRETITSLAKEIKEKYPAKTIWLYTGYLYEEICNLDIIKYIDVLVDGPFVENLKIPNLIWKGSSNQRVIRLHQEHSGDIG